MIGLISNLHSVKLTIIYISIFSLFLSRHFVSVQVPITDAAVTVSKIPALELGAYTVTSGWSGLTCADVGFSSSFNAVSDIRVQLSIDYRTGGTTGTQDGIIIRMTGVTLTSFRFCLNKMDPLGGSGSAVTVNYIVYSDQSVGALNMYSITDTISFYKNSQQRCSSTALPSVLAAKPFALITAHTPGDDEKWDGTIHIEDPGTSTVSWCVTWEKKQNANTVVDLNIYILVIDATFSYPDITIGKQLFASWQPSDTFSCETLSFSPTLSVVPPVFFTAVDHRDNPASNDGIAVWTERIQNTDAITCLREIDYRDGGHSDAYVDWIGFGDTAEFQAVSVTEGVTSLTVGVGTYVMLAITITSDLLPKDFMEVRTSAASGNSIHLYIRQGSWPTTDTFDQSATDSTGVYSNIIVPNPSAGTYYLMAKGTSTQAVFTTEIDFRDATALTFEGSVSSVAIGAGEWRMYSLTGATGYDSFSVVTTVADAQSNNPFRIYITGGSQPTVDSSEDSSLSSFSATTYVTTYENPVATTFYIAVRNLESARSFDLMTRPPDPVLLSLAPETGTTEGGETITLTGRNFGSTGTVKINGIAATVTSYSSTSVECTSPPGEGNNINVVLTTGGTDSNALQFSYNAPTVLSISPATGGTQGSETVTISGTNFGLNPNVTFNGFPLTISSHTHTTALVLTREGQGTLIPVQVGVAGQFSNADKTFSYTAPTISSFSPATGPTIGGGTVTLIGVNFGTTATVEIGGTNCPVTAQNHTVVKCTIPGGQGTGATVRISVSSQTHTAGGTFSYVAPTLSAVTPATASTLGGSVITLYGANFGTTPSVSIGAQACALVWSNHSAATCTLASGVGGGLTVQITVASQPSNTLSFSYIAPYISSVVPSLLGTAGTTLTLHGSNFGATGATVSVGGVACGISSQNNTYAVCSAAEGQGYNKAVVLTVGSQGSNSVLRNYTLPHLTSITPANGPSAGGTTLTIAGTNLGTSGSVTIGGVSCTVLGGGHTHTQIKCTQPAGVGTGLVVALSVSGQNSDNTLSFSYDAPVINGISPTHTPSEGGSFITVTGVNFGSGTSGGVISFGAQTCSYLAVNYGHSQIVCAAPSGSGTLLSVAVTVGLQTSNAINANYSLPSVSQVTPSTVSTDGTTLVTVTGSSFSTSGNVSVGGSACNVTSFTHTQALCVVPAGQGTSQAVVVTSLDYRSSVVSGSISYAAPTIASVTSPSTLSDGGYLATITGSNFGTGTGTITIGSNACTYGVGVSGSAYSHTGIICQVPEGGGAGQAIVLTVGGQVASSSTFSYAPPTLVALSPDHGPTGGGVNITLIGTSFTRSSATVTVAGKDCPNKYQNHTHIVCELPAGSGQDVVVQVTASSQQSNQLLFDYDVPTISAVTPSNGPTGGNVSIVIDGQNLGDGTVITIGGNACPLTADTQSSIRKVCQLPIGSGRNNIVSATVQGEASNLDFTFNYDAPNITSISPANGPTAGTLDSFAITLSGSSFGASGLVTVDGKSCSPTGSGHSHSSIECLLPEGSGISVAVIVTTDGQTSASKPFSYDSPNITSISPSVGDTDGGTTITLQGTSFGSAGSIQIGGRTCTVVNSVYSHSLIHCELPSGQGVQQEVQVTATGGALGLGSSNGVSFSYNPPSVSSITPSNGPTAGPPARITIFGSNFGLSGVATVAGSVCTPVTFGYLHGRIECEIPPGQNPSQVVRVNVSSQISAQSIVLNYDRPVISSVSPTNGPTNGGTVVLIRGNNFGLTQYVQIGGLNCSSLAANHTTALCTTPPNINTAHHIAVIAGTQTLVNPALFSYSYDAPTIHNITGCALANGDGVARCVPQGAENVTIYGENFGASGATVTVGGLACRNGGAIHDAAMPHNKLICALPYLVGLDKAVIVTVGAQSVTRDLVSYAGPELTANTLKFCDFGSATSTLLVNQTNPVGGYECVQFDGLDLGTNPVSTTTVTFGPASNLNQFSCTVLGASTTSRIQCTLPAQAVGKELSFQVHVDAGFNSYIQDSAQSSFNISYPAPVFVTDTIRETEAPKSPNDGDYIGVLTQGEFLYFDIRYVGSSSSLLSIQYGTTGTTKTQVCASPTVLTASDGAIPGVVRCQTAPGEQGPYVFEITALNQVSSESVDTYKYPIAPIIYRVEGCPVQNGNATENCPTDGGSLTLTMIGAEFTSSQLSAKVGVNDCTDIVYGGTTNFTCSLPAGAGVDQPVVVVTGAKFSRSKTLLSYAYPNITSVQGCAINTATSTSDCARIGGDNITISGTNFGASEATVLIGGQTCTHTTHASSPNSHTQVVCRTPSGTTTDRAVILIQNNGEISSNTGTLSYSQCPVGQYAASGEVTCQLCAKGSYSDTVGLFECKQCEAGLYADSVGSQSCTKCSIGRYSTRVNAMGAHNCTACPAGEFSSVEGLGACQQCPPGEYNNQTAQTTCTKCPAGTFTSIAGATTCTSCGFGSFSPSEGAVGCKTCQAGQYASVAGLSACTECLAGHYRGTANPPTACLPCAAGSSINVRGQAACLQCDSGKFSNATGLDVCYSCPAGAFSVKAGSLGATVCTACSAGEYINVDGQATCLKCAKGTYQVSTGGTTCPKCPAGTSQDQLGFSSCSNCTTGTYAPSTGTVVCEDCPAGSYTNLAGMSTCTGCAAGTFQQLAGQSLCSNCPLGSSIQSTGQVACKQCNSGFYSNSTGTAECSKCPVGTFSTKPINSGPTTCESCTAGRFVNAEGQADCVDCPVGYINTGTGQSSCVACTEGTFTSSAALTVCSNCTAGSYAPVIGSITCKQCPVGTISTTAAASACSDCEAGTFQSATGQSACTPCPIGSYTSSSGQALCLQCPTGRFNTEAGSTNCTACASGTYQNEAGKSTCKDCPTGEYVSSSGQSLCLSCPVGTYGNTVALSACLSCTKGTFSSTAGSTECTNCTTGRFSATDGLSYCDPCAGGTYNNLPGQSACTACDVGTYQSSQGTTSCAPCPAGKATSAQGQLICADCPVGTFSIGTGAQTCTNCPAGTISTAAASTGCTNCTAGRFSVADGSFVCEECDVGKYGAFDGMSVCADCSAGTYQSSAGQTACSPCATGSAVSVAGQRECIECAGGSYANVTGATACASCPAGSYSVQPGPSNGATVCSLCASGTFSSAIGQGSCASCPVGYFSASAGATACSACSTGTYTAAAASTICLSCGIGRFASGTGSISCPLCSIGTKGNRTGLDRCYNCPAGAYQSQQGQSRCELCSAGSYASASGQALCLPCDAGTVSASSGATGCIACTAGSYQADSGKTACSACAAGSAVAGTGEPVCTQCEPGTFANSTSMSACLQCPAGTYSEKTLSGSVYIGATRCFDCEIGRFVSSVGQGQCEECPQGTYAGSPAQTICTDCPIGTFASSIGTVSCDACALGRYNPSLGQTICLFCGEGTASNTTAATTCTSCGLGSYQRQTGQSSCLPCAAGTFTTATGQAECSLCDYGTYSNTTGVIGCIDCGQGSYQDELGSSVCKLCGTGTYSDSIGTKTCKPCGAGTYSTATGKTICDECPAGTAQPSTGASVCSSCGLGRFTPTSRQAECSLCGRGTFGNQTSMSNCHLCPPGTYNPGEGQTSCRLCSPGYFSGNGHEVCDVCGDGTIAAVSGTTACVACDVNSAPNFFKTQCDCDVGYYLASSDGNTFECQVCPTGADCTTAGTTFQSMTSLSGYWRAVNSSLTFYRCILRKHCVGGRDETSGSSSCESTHTGPLCAVCKEGYYGTAGGNCSICPENESVSFMYMFLIGCAVVVFVWLQLYIILRSDRTLMNRVSRAEELDEWENASQEGYGNFSDGDDSQSDGSGYSGYSMSMSDWSAASALAGKRGRTPAKGFRTSSSPGSPRDGDNDMDDSGHGDADMTLDGDAVSEEDASVSRSVSHTFGDPESDEEDLSSEYSYYTEATNATTYSVRKERFYRQSLEYNEYRLTVHGPPKPKPNFTYKLKIALGFAQIVTNIGSGLEIQWPTRFKEFILWFDMFNIDFILVQGSSADCVGGVDYYRKFLMIVLMPIVVFLVIACVYLLPRWAGLCCFKHLSRAERTLSTLRFWKMSLYMLFLIYPAVSSTVLRLYVCKDIEEKSYLLSDFSVECYTETWTIFSYASMCLVLLYPIGIPLFFLTLLLVNRHHLRYDRVKAQLGFLYAGYRLDVWYFEILDTIHKLFLTAVLAFFPTASQLPLGMCVSVAYMMTILIMNPYIRVSDDRLHLLAQAEIFLLLCAGNVFYHLPTTAFEDDDDFWLSITLMFMTCAFLLVFLWSGIVVMYRMLKKCLIDRREQKAVEAAEKDDEELEDFPKTAESESEDDDNDKYATRLDPEEAREQRRRSSILRHAARRSTLKNSGFLGRKGLATGAGAGEAPSPSMPATRHHPFGNLDPISPVTPTKAPASIPLVPIQPASKPGTLTLGPVSPNRLRPLGPVSPGARAGAAAAGPLGLNASP
jgi:IPT/TIG domain/Tyrosine-protein kinase ephrin type A/B receptor-like